MEIDEAAALRPETWGPGEAKASTFPAWMGLAAGGGREGPKGPAGSRSAPVGSRGEVALIPLRDQTVVGLHDLLFVLSFLSGFVFLVFYAAS